MVIEYLEKMHHKMYDQKLNLERECQKKEILLKDNIKFIRTLENSLDENYESFSPREINQESHQKIDFLLEEKEKIESEIDELKIEILKLDESLLESENVLKAARENAKKILEKEKVQEEKEIYPEKILEVQELENQRIARDLHDYIMQDLTNIVHKIEICTKILDIDTIRCRLELQAISKSIKDTIQEIRKVVYDLRPMSLDDIGLDSTIEKELLKIGDSVNVLYETVGKKKKLSSIISLTLLRIIQEACKNIVEHANAKNVNVLIIYADQYVKLEIKDDGVGFDTSSIKHLNKKKGSGFGIPTMKERICLLFGKLQVDSEPGKGTKVVVEIPIAKEDA
ncbi:MAG: sensor histidine kinase [Lachnospiraceae bacterium]|nr:sensor histidine kinase [Lachnospiraceae bacterium]